MHKLIQTLWKIFLITFPFSISFVLYEKNSYRFGNFNPWVTGFLFLPELLLILTFSLWLFIKWRQKTIKPFRQPRWTFILLLIFLINAGLVTFFTGDMTLYLFFFIRVLEAFMVFTLIREKLIPDRSVMACLLYGAAFQIILAFLQTRLNHSIGLYVIGEPFIGPQILNVAKNTLVNGEKLIRPYGTFLHPNILAAYLMTILLLSLQYLKKSALAFWMIFICVGIYLTHSQAAELTLLLIAIIFLFFKFLKTDFHRKVFCFSFLGLLTAANIWIFLRSASLLSYFSSIQERLSQNIISLNMLLNKFWGVGVGQFTLEMEKFSKNILSPWDFQPVHNVYFLILNETGIQGFFIFLIFIAFLVSDHYKTSNQRDMTRFLPLLGLMVIASFDHLLMTSWMGVMLLGMVSAQLSSSY